MATRRATPAKGNEVEETIAIGFRVPRELYDQIHERCEAEDRTVQAWLVRAARAALAKKAGA